MNRRHALTLGVSGSASRARRRRHSSCSIVPRPRSSASRLVSSKRDRDAAIGEGHGDAAAHRAGADDADAADPARGARPCTPATLAASRSAKNRWRCACDWSLATSFTNSSRSAASASSKGSVDRIAHRLRAGDRRFQAARLLAPGRAASASKAARSAFAISRRGRAPAEAAPPLRRLRGRSARACVGQIAFDDSVDQPAPCASAALIGVPETIISSAFTAPTRRGSRTVPPPPGRRPSFTSGRPSFAPASATRKWQPSASSSPPPSAVPWMAATVGLPMRLERGDRGRADPAAAAACRIR